MGLLSLNCFGCGHPILSDFETTETNQWMKKCVAIPKGFDPSKQEAPSGIYDGYGTIDDEVGNNIYSYYLEEEPRVWHKACWVSGGKPQLEHQMEGPSV